MPWFNYQSDIRHEYGQHFFSMSATDKAPAHRKHTKFFFDDGDIVLSANSSTRDSAPESTVLFRVHKLLLSTRSEVFCGMFEVNEGRETAGDEGLFEGVVVFCSSESAGFVLFEKGEVEALD